MFINGIPAGAGLQLIATVGAKTMEFSTKAAEVYDDYIFAEPILNDGKMLGFSSKGLELAMFITDAEEGRAWIFKGIKVRNVKKKDGSLFHEISCKTEGKAVNRRNAVRVWIGEQGSASVGLSMDVFDVLIKDVSSTGIAFICDKSREIPENAVVNISFKDPTTDTRFEVVGLVVRTAEMEKERRLYGCKLNQDYPAIDRLINEKQREKLRASRQSGGKK